jgi:chemotaxis signal transduction protein
VEILSFSYQGDFFCIKATDIHEVINSVDPVSLPRIPDPFEGVFQHRGNVFSLMSFGRCMARFHGIISTEIPDSQIIIFAEPYHQFAIRVPIPLETISIDREEISVVAPEKFSAAILDGIVNRGEQRYHLISAMKLFLHAGKLISETENARRFRKGIDF